MVPLARLDRSGQRRLAIRPGRGVWHRALVRFDDHAEYLDRQSWMHARVSVDFPREFGCYLPCRWPGG
jgi:hypothetical protein